MGESLIVRKAGGGSSNLQLITKLITENTTWVAPKTKDQKFSVRIFGGGGGSCIVGTYQGLGGAGGWMNNNVLTIPAGTSVAIKIGYGGSYDDSGTNGGGGGGGYGGDGGCGMINGGGGGGGYGKRAIGGNNGGGGGGYYSKGGDGNRFGGGGGGYGDGAIFNEKTAGYGGGGAGFDAYGRGGDGICIIQYYI